MQSFQEFLEEKELVQVIDECLSLLDEQSITEAVVAQNKNTNPNQTPNIVDIKKNLKEFWTKLNSKGMTRNKLIILKLFTDFEKMIKDPDIKNVSFNTLRVLRMALNRAKQILRKENK